MFGNHIIEVKRLSNIQRFHNKFRIKGSSVAEHSFYVAKIAHGLAMWEMMKFKNAISMETVLFLAINHDVVECYTGDILSPMKTEGLRKELSRIEELIMEEMYEKTLPQGWRPYFKARFSEMEELSTLEARIVKAADVIDRCTECLEEVNLGNSKIFLPIFQEDIDLLLSYNIESVNFFLKYAMKDLGGHEYMTDVQLSEILSKDYKEYF